LTGVPFSPSRPELGGTGLAAKQEGSPLTASGTLWLNVEPSFFSDASRWLTGLLFSSTLVLITALIASGRISLDFAAPLKKRAAPFVIGSLSSANRPLTELFVPE
jgi:hypothetical protein